MSGTVLITGGLGYVGGRLSRHLAERGWTVRVGTRDPRKPRPEWLKRGELVRADVNDPDSLAAAVAGVDAVVHLAAVNEIEAGKDPEKALLVGTLGTLRMVRAAAQAKVPRLLFFSTAHVYGAPLEGTLTEDKAPRPMHPYSYTHHAAEDIVLAAKGKDVAAPVVVRLSNGFGAPERLEVDRWTLLVNDLCRQAVTQFKVVLKSPGLQLRDWVTLADVAHATEHLLTLSPSVLGDGLFNLGGAHVESVLSMAERVCRVYEDIYGTRIPLERPLPLPGEAKPKTLDFSISRLIATGFRPKGDFDGEIRRTLEICQGFRPPDLTDK